MLVYRRLGRDDAQALCDHLLGLAPADRIARFHGPQGDEVIRAYVAGLDWGTHGAIGAFHLRPGRTGAEAHQLIAVAEVHFDQTFAPRVAEVAVSVDPAFRQHGVGTRLVERVVDEAARRQAIRLVLHYQPDHAEIPRLVKRLGGQVRPFVHEAVIEVPHSALVTGWWRGLHDAQLRVMADLLLPWFDPGLDPEPPAAGREAGS